MTTLEHKFNLVWQVSTFHVFNVALPSLLFYRNDAWRVDSSEYIHGLQKLMQQAAKLY